MPNPNSLEQAALAHDYARPCIALLETLVDRDPDWLLAVMKSDATFPPHLLTFACEYIGRLGSKEAFDVLVSQLKHETALVREGALMGLDTMVDTEYRGEIVALLQHVAASDTEQMIRDCAKEMLE